MGTDSDWHRRFDSFSDEDRAAIEAALRADAKRIEGDWRRVGDDFRKAMQWAPLAEGFCRYCHHRIVYNLAVGVVRHQLGAPATCTSPWPVVPGVTKIPTPESWWRRVVRKAKPW